MTKQISLTLLIGILFGATVSILPASSAPATIRTLSGRSVSQPSIDKLVSQYMAENNVLGLGLSLIRDGSVVFTKAYGLRDVERQLPLQNDTVMYGASLTKSAFSYYVLQLVDAGRIDLDKSIADYLPKPLPEYPEYADLKGDERWRQITMRILLDQTSGFPNLRQFDPVFDLKGKLRIHRDPGTRFGYSGEGFNLAQFVVEKSLGLSVDSEMQRLLFTPLGMTRTSMTWRDEFSENVAQGYDATGKLIPHSKRKRAGAAGSMDTTLSDEAQFLAAAVRGEGLSKKMRTEMVQQQVAIDSPHQFPTLDPERTDQWRAIKLGYGLGWGVFETPFGHAFFKEGHDDGTANYALCVDRRRDCILIMSDSVRAEQIFTALVDRLLGPVNLPWSWEGYAPDK